MYINTHINTHINALITLTLSTTQNTLTQRQREREETGWGTIPAVDTATLLHPLILSSQTPPGVCATVFKPAFDAREVSGHRNRWHNAIDGCVGVQCVTFSGEFSQVCVRQTVRNAPPLPLRNDARQTVDVFETILECVWESFPHILLQCMRHTMAHRQAECRHHRSRTGPTHTRSRTFTAGGEGRVSGVCGVSSVCWDASFTPPLHTALLHTVGQKPSECGHCVRRTAPTTGGGCTCM